MSSVMTARQSRTRRAPMSIWAVIVNWKRPDLTDECIRLLEECGYSSLEIVVVDNASDDRSSADLMASHPGVKFVRLPFNLGYAGGASAGMGEAIANGADAVLVLNNDCRPIKGFLGPLVQELLSNPTTGAAGPLQIGSSHGRPGWVNGGQRFDLRRASLDRDGVTGFATPPVTGRFTVGFNCGACVLYRTEALRDVGLFDPRLYLFSEEPDWAERAAARGWAATAIAESRVGHDDETTTSTVRMAFSYFMARNQCWLVRRYGTRRDTLVNAVRTLCWRMPKAAAGHLGRRDPKSAWGVFRGSIDGVFANCSPGYTPSDAMHERRYELAGR